MKRIGIILLLGLFTVSMTACKGVSIDGDTARIAEENCSITFIALNEVPYEAIAAFTDNGEVTYSTSSGSGAIIYTLDDRFSFYEVKFTHQGKHDLSSLVFQAVMGGFAADTKFTYYTDSTQMDGQARIIAGNIGNSSAYLFCYSEDVITRCEFEHKGYYFNYDFISSEWSYSE